MKNKLAKIKKEVSKSDNYRTVTFSEFDQMKKDFIDTEVDRYSEEYKPVITEIILKIEIGGMYFHGNIHDREYDILIIDNIIKKPHRYRKERKEPNAFEYYLQVRQWDYEKGNWGPIAHRSKNYEYEYELEEFVKGVHLPKLSKSPGELWIEAEAALLSGDVDKYAMDQAQRQDTEGPDTQLMHIGSKESLIAVQKDLEAKRGHAIAIQNTMTMIIEQKKRALERVKDRMNAMLVVFEKQIKKIMRVITTIELYLGIEEEVTQIQEGPLADVNEPISIRQGLMFMDEEVGDPWDDGQGLEWDKKGVAAFDDWLTRNDNYKKVLPEKKGIAAFQTRRDFKKRANHGNPFMNIGKMEGDMQTFLLIRNGDNLYRLITDKIAFRPRLFPKRNELQKLFEYWKIADAIEHKKKDADAWMSLDHLTDNIKEQFEKMTREHDGNKVSDAKEFAEDSVFFYKMRLTLFQGLIDRSDILHPLKEPNIKLFSPDAQEQGLVRLIYDDELTLPSGRPTFWQWMKKLNSTIDFGSRIILSHNWSFKQKMGHNEMEDYERDNAKDFHVNRLDDRYGSGSSGNWSHVPPKPQEGLYYVKRGERWQNDPVWIDNPWYNPDLLETVSEPRYCPDYNLKEYPKDPKSYSKSSRSEYHIELNPHIRMTFAQQIAYFGKVVEKSINPSDDEKNVSGLWLHGIVKNPKKIHKYTMVPEQGWKGGEWVEFKGMKPEFENHDVKYTFPCIRYNPKDMVGEIKMIRYYDDEPTERKNNISWKIYNDDAFIVNYDEIKVEDIDFYLTSRVDRRHYIFMMPLLWQVRNSLLEERKSEVDFKRLVQGEVLRITGTIPSDEQIDQACENWKKNLKWKRAISHDDQKALRMIVKELSKE